MKGALIHGVLLAVMLVYGYRTWTRDKTVGPDLGSVVLWDKAEADLVSIAYTSDKKTVKLERRGDGAAAYWWGTDTTTDKKPKPPEPKKPEPGAGSGSAEGSGAGSAAGSGSAGSGAGSGSAVASAGSGSAGSGSAGSGSGSAGSGSGSAVASAGSGSAGSGSGAGSGSAATPEVKPPVEEVVTTKVREFPLGAAGDKLITGYVAARALRDLGPPTDKDKKDYKLVESKATIVVAFKDGKHTFALGGSVYGGSDKYALDQETGRAYVLSKDLISALEIGESSLQLVDPRGFEVTKIESVTVEATGKSKVAARVQTGVDGQQVKTWGDADTKKADQTLANFIDNTNNLRPTEYSPTTKVADLTQIMKLTYKDEPGKTLGTLVLYKRDKPGATPPTIETEYFIVTERTRVPALVRKDTAQRTEQDVPTVFGAPPVPRPLDPKGKPLGMPAPDHSAHGH